MYSSQKPRQQQQQPLLHFYKQEQEEDQEPISEMMIEIQQQPQQNQMIMGESSGGEDHEAEIEMRAPKKRAETWVQEETRNLIAFRRDMDGQFNTSKSNKHLWEQISGKMRDKGFDRSPTMCTDKWRNLLKEFKKARHLDNSATGSVTKMSYYKDIDEILKERTKSVCFSKSPTPPISSKVESFLQFSDKGMEDTGISFGPVEATGGLTLNPESRLDHDEHPITITAADTVATSVPPWGWRDTPINGGEGQSFCGRVITVKWGDYTRRIGIDATSEAIKEAIRAAFRLRSKRLFWLEDEYQIVRSLDRDMPLGNYTLHLDEGMAIKVCLYDESDQIHVHTEEKIFYNEEDHRDYLARRGWTCLRELDGFRNIDNLDDLQPGAMYRGVS